MNRNIITFAILLIAICLPSSLIAKSANKDISPLQLETALKALDNAMLHRDHYRSMRIQRIDSLKREAARKPSVANFEELAQTYMQVNNDSVLHYYKCAIDIAEGAESQLMKAKYAAQMPVSGFVESAGHMYESVDTTGFTNKQKSEYYDAGRRMYISMTAFFANYPDTAIVWSKKATECQLKMLQTINAETEPNLYRTVHGEYLLRSGRVDLAEITLKDVYDSEPEVSPLRSRVAHLLSHIVGARKENNAKLRYLASSVMADLKSGSVELTSLQDLGMSLSSSGDDERAFRYLNMALTDASEASSLIRQIQSVSMVPIVQAAHVETLEESRYTLRFLVVALILALGLLVVTLFFLYRDMSRLKVTRRKLSQTNNTKEIYMSQFLQLCSVYMERLTNFSNMVKRKIAAGKMDDVARMVKSGKFMEEQTADFFEVFDSAFLHIYPTFVTDINKLLRADEQILLKEGERMNTDLRILAFYRMGIDDSAKIAQILGYSVNTIYAYRNKLKGKAIDRNTFETDILKIDAIE